MGVVAGIPGPIHAGADAVLAEEGLVAVGPVLDTAVGVEQEPLAAGPETDGLPRRPCREIHRAIVTQGVTEDSSGAHVHHGSEVAEATLGLEIGDVADPLLIRSGRDRLILSEVRGGNEEAGAVAAGDGSPSPPGRSGRPGA